MPASGKSTIGVLLASGWEVFFCRCGYCDSGRNGKLLNKSLKSRATEAILKVEEEINSRLDVTRSATAWEEVSFYGPAAMEHLK